MIRKTISCITLLCCFFLWAQTVPASTPDEASKEINLTTADFHDFFSETMSALMPAHVDEITVSNFASQPESIRLPPGKISYHLTSQSKVLSPGKKFITATLLVNGKEYDTLRMKGTIHFWGSVVCAADTLPARRIIEEKDVISDFRDISMLGADIIRTNDDAIGKKLKKSLKPGSILYGKLLQNPLLVRRGDLVTIRAKNKSLLITTKGEVRSNGSLGEIVRVKNLTSHRLLHARVIAEGLVQIDL